MREHLFSAPAEVARGFNGGCRIGGVTSSAPPLRGEAATLPLLARARRGVRSAPVASSPSSQNAATTTVARA